MSAAAKIRARAQWDKIKYLQSKNESGGVP